jgi:hypothetical protein
MKSNSLWDTSSRSDFQNDSALTTTQKKSMQKHQDAQNEPGNMPPDDCVCFKCNNYVWDTCGGNTWVKNGPCSYGNTRYIC